MQTRKQPADILIEYFQTVIAKTNLKEQASQIVKLAEESGITLDYNDNHLEMIEEGLDKQSSDNLNSICVSLKKQLEEKLNKTVELAPPLLHVGSFYDKRESGARLFYDGFGIDSLIAPLFYEDKIIENFTFRLNLFNPVLTPENLQYFKQEFVEYFFNPILENDNWKSFWENQINLIIEEKKDKDIAVVREYIQELLKRISGAYIYALANACATVIGKPNDCILDKGACNLHFKRELPEELDNYKHSYIWVNKDLFYVNIDGVLKRIPVVNEVMRENITAFEFEYIGTGMICLSNNQVYDFITVHTGHAPERKERMAIDNTTRQHLVSILANSYHLPLKTIIDGQIKDLANEMQNSFNNLLPIVMPKDMSNLVNSNIINKVDKNYSKGVVNQFSIQLQSVRLNKQYRCIKQADELFITELNQLFSTVKQLKSKFSNHVSNVANVIGVTLQSIEINNVETLRLASKLYDNVEAYLDKGIKGVLHDKLDKYAKHFKSADLKSPRIENKTTKSDLNSIKDTKVKYSHSDGENTKIKKRMANIGIFSISEPLSKETQNLQKTEFQLNINNSPTRNNSNTK